ncbi:MAG: T9SS type A sorting domain-containing protein [Taibaiella sp.]|nr:T9SS type A sorting domain-containing protein [Taibaiella sp.]
MKYLLSCLIAISSLTSIAQTASRLQAYVNVGKDSTLYIYNDAHKGSFIVFDYNPANESYYWSFLPTVSSGEFGDRPGLVDFDTAYLYYNSGALGGKNYHVFDSDNNITETVWQVYDSVKGWVNKNKVSRLYNSDRLCYEATNLFWAIGTATWEVSEKWIWTYSDSTLHSFTDMVEEIFAGHPPTLDTFDQYNYQYNSKGQITITNSFHPHEEYKYHYNNNGLVDTIKLIYLTPGWVDTALNIINIYNINKFIVQYDTNVSLYSRLLYSYRDSNFYDSRNNLTGVKEYIDSTGPTLLNTYTATYNSYDQPLIYTTNGAPTVRYYYETYVTATPTPYVIQIYPNPVKDELQIRHTELPHATFVLTDITGKLVATQQLSGGNGIERMNVHALPPGVYVYCIISNEVTIARGKVVKE